MFPSGISRGRPVAIKGINESGTLVKFCHSEQVVSFRLTWAMRNMILKPAKVTALCPVNSREGWYRTSSPVFDFCDEEAL